MNIELRTYNYALCIMYYELTLGVPEKPSGFPLYLFPLRSKRMPLQSLTRPAIIKIRISKIKNLKILSF